MKNPGLAKTKKPDDGDKEEPVLHSDSDSDSDSDNECRCKPGFSGFFCKNGYRIVEFSEGGRTCPDCEKWVSLDRGPCWELCGECENEDEESDEE